MAMASMVRRTGRLVARERISDAAGRQPEQVAAGLPSEVGTPAVTSSRSAAPIAIACMLGILAVFIADLNTPTQVTVSALGVFPIAAAAWLLSRRAMLSVLLLAILAEVVLGFYGAISLVSSWRSAADAPGMAQRSFTAQRSESIWLLRW